MITITDIEQLILPQPHKDAITHMLIKLQEYPVVKNIILFGSCARQCPSLQSDIDLALITAEEITPEDEWDIDSSIRNWDINLPCDIIFLPEYALKQIPKGDTIIRPILQEGVQLDGLLHKRL